MMDGSGNRPWLPAAIFSLFLVASFILPGVPLATSATEDLLSQAKDANRTRVDFALANHAEINATEGSKSFTLFWTPKNYNPRNGILVSLHGHGSWAFDEFFIWKPILEKRGMAFLGLQWWLGKGEETSDYYTPKEMYPEIERVLRRKQLKPGKAILHGFSRGSANTYALVALDRSTGGRFFRAVIANAGGASMDYFPNQEIDLGMYGTNVFSGVSWVLYCGGKDENSEQDGCAAMRRTKKWIEKQGGKVVLFIKDLTEGHGGFHRNNRRVEQALDALT